MKYIGSKNKYSNDILPFILNNRQPNQFYVEPFVGGFNLIDKVSGNRIGNDIHFYLIELFKAIQNGWIPPEYIDIRINKDKYPSYLVGFVGFGCSFSGKWFGGYARGANRNYALESKKNLLKQAPYLKGIIIENKSYNELVIPDNSIIYCDPPYNNTTKYKNSIDYDIFWQWCRDKSIQGHKVYISEYNAPSDFISIWNKTVHSDLKVSKDNKTNIEYLFIYNI